MPREIIRSYMTSTPYSATPATSIAAARQLMRQHDIRHLPVIEDEKPVGIVSERDLALCERLKEGDPATVPIADAMTPFPFCVNPEAPLHDVVLEMVKHRYGSVIVTEQGRAVGVFTTVDALRALAATLYEKEQLEMVQAEPPTLH